MKNQDSTESNRDYEEQRGALGEEEETTKGKHRLWS